ncbi:MAG: gamma-glutamylcyclotransferase [Crenarchaeota archaeon]|nr:gamma-glutamylcyclotransferase [Thermoproteota archaeon]
MGMTYLFVYGTLMRGCPLHGALEEIGATFVSPAVTAERHTLYDVYSGGERYPAMLLGGGEHYVMGELYLVPEEGLERLDVIEGVTEGEYKRVKVKVKRQDTGSVVEAYAYVIDPDFLEKMILEGKAEPLVSLSGDVVRWSC